MDNHKSKIKKTQVPAVIFEFFFDFRSFFQVYPLASRYDPNIFQDMAFTSYIGAGRECKREEKKIFFCSEIIPSDDCIVKFFFIFRMSPCAPRAFFAKIKNFYMFMRSLVNSKGQSAYVNTSRQLAPRTNAQLAFEQLQTPAPRAFFAKIKDFYVFERFLARKASFQSGARRSFD